MDGLTYEILIRRAFHCGRGGVPGAEATIYRKMENAHHGLNAGHPYKSKIDLEIEFNGAAATVVRNINEAIKQALKEIKYDTDREEEREKLEKLHGKLPLNPTKEQIDELMNEVLKIFIYLKLEAR